ncbi:pyruvate, phosphate dikinase, partial [Candidatus Woesearchaeota archaeon]|nr:pyruvate, phosphate dikinase [Candidatus Woesearchaeota archaeon]
LGIPVPPGFTITTEVCDLYYKNNRSHQPEVIKQIDDKLAELEKEMGKKLGDSEDPLLVSVRSGAAISMPGMMDTVLNLGLNDKSVLGIAKKSGNERFAWDAYRRFIQMFGNVVMGIEGSKFEHVLEKAKETKGVEYDTELDAADLKGVVEGYKKVVMEAKGVSFPQEPRKQLQMSIDAVFGSWNNSRAKLYRKLNDIKGLLGTAVNVQAMVFGNMGDNSATGVCFSRNPANGENKFYGEFLVNAQGEDVVAGIRTPLDIVKLGDVMPKCYKELLDIRNNLEKHFREMQDMEFTIQEGKLYMLQTRTGKRTAAASVRIAVEMVDEGLLTKKEAVMRVDPNQLDHLLHKQIDQLAKSKSTIIAKGLPASPGAAVGEVVFDAEEADSLATEGRKVILVRTETSPEDLIGMNAAQGILTARGGMTSHAAVVARGMGKCCVAGCADVRIDESAGVFRAADITIKKGEVITLDGTTGEVYQGELPLKDPEMSGNFGKLMGWADEFRRLKVRTNADTPHDSQVARKFGAEGIGLCRTEHMFFEGERIRAMREMILADSLEGRKKALAKLLPMQRQDFKGLFEVMKGLPVTIRLLDPPLHEFLPRDEEEIRTISKEMGVTPEKIKSKIEDLHEQNPMLGHRGCRLGITYPEITEMQARAIFEAACGLKKAGQDIVPEVMIPLVGNINEFAHQKEVVVQVAEQVMAETGTKVKYLVGTMIEVPRGALTADEIAKEAEFFSFGTNDLTQMTLGYSRDDVGKFVGIYLQHGILEKDPFQVLDQVGVGQLVRTAIEKGRASRPNIKLGICGEHGGEPSSVEFCHRVGLDYVSCSPFRVPIARLAAAHAVLKESEVKKKL